MTEKTLSVPSVSCDHCKMSIEDALNTVDGVTTATVDIPAKTVELAFDEEAVTLDRIVSAIQDAGYEVVR
ncbi:MAG: copper ion binding protein [Acidimicrobiia bacterium]|nr:copper ion binding protein [Acidimicrobiia bacterium]